MYWADKDYRLWPTGGFRIYSKSDFQNIKTFFKSIIRVRRNMTEVRSADSVDFFSNKSLYIYFKTQ